MAGNPRKYTDDGNQISLLIILILKLERFGFIDGNVEIVSNKGLYCYESLCDLCDRLEYKNNEFYLDISYEDLVKRLNPFNFDYHSQLDKCPFGWISSIPPTKEELQNYVQSETSEYYPKSLGNPLGNTHCDGYEYFATYIIKGSTLESCLEVEKYLSSDRGNRKPAKIFVMKDGVYTEVMREKNE